ncbi:MAG: hypothetical protein ACFFBD_11795 [Candidatus Hodarchaeota archaeon]
MSSAEQVVDTVEITESVELLRKGLEDALGHGILDLPARVVVVDGSNVAYAVHGPQSKPKVFGIISMRKKLLEHGFIPVCLIGATLKYHIDKPDLVRELIKQEILIEAPAGVSDDRFLIATVKEFDGFILTNDLFRDILPPQEIDWFIQRRIAYKFILKTPVLLFPPKTGKQEDDATPKDGKKTDKDAG